MNEKRTLEEAATRRIAGRLRMAAAEVDRIKVDVSPAARRRCASDGLRRLRAAQEALAYMVTFGYRAD